MYNTSITHYYAQSFWEMVTYLPKKTWLHPGDICFVLSANRRYIYDGSKWIELDMPNGERRVKPKKEIKCKGICPGCGAPITSMKCEYCEREFYEN